jgi:WD40 repeat protein
MEVSKRACHTVGVACRSDAAVKLVDLRTMAGTHSLVGHDQGVLCLQWSPASEFVLASAGADCCVRLWDVRKAGGLACLSVLNHRFVEDSTLSRPGLPHYAHLRQQQELRARSPLSSLPTKVPVAISGGVRHAQTTASDRPVLNLSFDPSGGFLVTHDGSLAVWDLRDGQGGFQIPRSFVNAHGSVQLLNKASAGRRREGSALTRDKPPLSVTDDGDGWTIWTATDASIVSYSMHGESKPRQQLDGHISTVQALAAASNELVVSSGRDGLILLWGYAGGSAMRPKNGRSVKNDIDSW